MNFVMGVPTLPVYKDVWQIDAGVCLLTSDGKVRGPAGESPRAWRPPVPPPPPPGLQRPRLGHPGPRLGHVQLPGRLGGAALRDVRGRLRPGRRLLRRLPLRLLGPLLHALCQLRPARLLRRERLDHAGACVGGGGGVGCSLRAINPPRPPPPLPQVPNQGQCKCATGWGGTYCGQCATGYAGTLCQTCADGFWGSSCSACPACGANGACSGNGTKGGSGACICANGWTGPLCTVPPPSSSSSSSGTPPADAGAIAAGVIFGVLGAAAIGVFVYARFFGGGPAVAAAWAATVRTLSFGTGSSAKLERTSLMSSGAAATRLGSSSAY